MTIAAAHMDILADALEPANAIEAEIVAFLGRLPSAAALGAIDRSTPLLTSGLLDSLGVLELTELLSSRFDVAIADEDFTTANFATVGAFVALIESKRRGS